jgi:hypothetical protein
VHYVISIVRNIISRDQCITLRDKKNNLKDINIVIRVVNLTFSNENKFPNTSFSYPTEKNGMIFDDISVNHLSN